MSNQKRKRSIESKYKSTYIGNNKPHEINKMINAFMINANKTNKNMPWIILDSDDTYTLDTIRSFDKTRPIIIIECDHGVYTKINKKIKKSKYNNVQVINAGLGSLISETDLSISYVMFDYGCTWYGNDNMSPWLDVLNYIAYNTDDEC